VFAHASFVLKTFVLVVIVFMLASLTNVTRLTQAQSMMDLQVVQSRYIIQGDTPVNLPNFVQPAAGCDWNGIGGQVFDLDGAPITGVVVRANGNIDHNTVTLYALSGSAAQFGPAGYLFTLADHSVISGTVTLELLDINGAPRADPLVVHTINDCQKNLTIVNWREIATQFQQKMPLILR
jgi:hypothetical protein